ncbi:hypothetical protein MDUV_45110 [Mycolicibacterium duvalii]|uniref:Uncharacterized protein n=2 Tax=Mycolicibacterium duvalii TaxID=39688 RepID=A0A7I7K823_9MYCO|nr:hypothetical protein MDUV_45110 [Mycolicibacterium duvalii]
MTMPPEVVVLADHPIWIAVPAFAPAFVVAGVVVYIAVRNRKKREAGESRDN